MIFPSWSSASFPRVDLCTLPSKNHGARLTTGGRTRLSIHLRRSAQETLEFSATRPVLLFLVSKSFKFLKLK